MSRSAERQSRLPDRATRWFERARASLLGELPCRRGCNRCCIGPFAITVLDVAELQRGLAALAPAVREDILARARHQAGQIETDFPRLREASSGDGARDSELDAAVERFADLPCPALDPDGSCRVYAFRPLTCRTMGIPVEADGLVEGACEVQTAIPIVRLCRALREEEERLAEEEAIEIERARSLRAMPGEEVLSVYGFL